MQSKHFLGLAVVFMMAACQPKNQPQEAQTTPTETSEKELRRTPEFNLTDTLGVGSHKWVYTIHREADDSLQIVTDEEGERYADNFYQLKIVKDGGKFFNRRFTKADFMSRLSPRFRQYGVLDGCRFNRYENGQLLFSLCVSYPESDEYTPFLLKIGPDGSYAIEEDDMLDVGDIEMSDEMLEKLHNLEETETEE
jgi:hypothetical protein